MSLLRVRGISRAFPGVLALHGVDLELRPGEVLAVIGENGAGKSTLMKILAGVLRPDAGRIELDGQPVSIDSPRAASRLGISLIHQELNLCTNLSIAANLFLGREPRCRGLIDRAALRRDAVQVLARVGLDLVPEVLVGELSLGRRQLVEIARALSAQARILIMDEPTSSLTVEEAGILFAVIRELRQLGVSVIYISHRLGEVRQVADRVSVLRDGRNAGELGPDQITHEAMVSLMVGRDLSGLQQGRRGPPGEPALVVEKLVVPGRPAIGVSFTVGRGEILGLAGLVGAGRTELLRTLFGVVPAAGGRVLVEGREQSLRTPAEAIRAGLALVPEDRKEQGLILELSVRHNIGLPSLGRHRRLAGLTDRGQEQADATAMVAQLGIRTPGLDQRVQLLSGGNQQKVVLGKWLALRPRVLLLDEPTRGVDVGAKQELYRLIEELADQGVAILFASSDLEELLRLSDRVLVMYQGRLTGELSREEAGEEAVMRLATG